MEYINVSQFYESILCFAIPLLIIQRVLLFSSNLSIRYEDYRRTFYEDQFKFTKEYEFSVQEPEIPPDSTLKDQIIEAREANEDPDKKEKDIQAEHNNDQQNRSRIISFSYQNEGVLKRSESKESKEFKQINKITVDLQTDRELKNSYSVPTLPGNIEQSEAANMQVLKIQKKATQGKQQIQSELETEHKQAEEPKTGNKIQVEQIQESRMSRLTQSDIQVRRETQLDDQIEDPYSQSTQQGQQKNKQVIQIGRGKLQEQGEQDQVKLKYCRRVDDAFNDYIPIIMSVVVLGILTKSVYIYSMCCFFGYAFSSLLFNYIHLLDRLEGINTQTVFGRANQLVSSLFIIGLFISYWISDQFYYA